MEVERPVRRPLQEPRCEMMRNGTRAVLVEIDSLEGFEKFLGGKPFRAQCMAGWVLREKGGKHLEGPVFSMDNRVCGAAGSTAGGTASRRALDLWYLTCS